MTDRKAIALGMAIGALWAAGTVWLALSLAPARPAFDGLALGALVAALPLAALIVRLAAFRFFDPVSRDGAEPVDPGALTDLAVLRNTVEQTLLAALVWPAIAWTQGGGAVPVLATGFALARAAFWIGYRLSPPLRAFGFAGGFYATLLAAAVACAALLTGTPTPDP